MQILCMCFNFLLTLYLKKRMCMIYHQLIRPESNLYDLTAFLLCLSSLFEHAEAKRSVEISMAITLIAFFN